MHVSMFREFSIGIVAENKALSATRIMVIPVEHMTMLDGDLKSNPTPVSSQGKDAQGNNYTVHGTMDNAIPAEWLRGTNTNRRTAPDVRRGERVRLFRYADTTQVYWEPMGLDDHLRKGETVIFAFSGTLDEAKDGTQPGNCWFVEISTHTGMATFETSKGNGEYCKYTFQFNAKEGNVILQDDLGNSFEMDSKNTLLKLVNAVGASLVLDKKVIEAYAPDAINLEADNAISAKTKAFSVQAETVDVKANTAAITADTTITGTTEIKGSTTLTGDTTINGNSTLNGDVTSSGTLQANKVVSILPIQAPNV